MRGALTVRLASLLAAGWVLAATAAEQYVPPAAADFIASVPVGAPPVPLQQALAHVDTDRLRQHMAWLSDPQREGRGLGTRGLVQTADYLAGQLAAIGVVPLSAPRPAAAATYFQDVPLREVRHQGGEVVLPALRSGAAVKWRSGISCVLPQIAPQVITGPLVFAGWAIREPALGYDDLRGLDVRGKVVVFRSGVPPGPEWQQPDLLDRYANRRPEYSYDTRLEVLGALGARAAIAIEDHLAERLRLGQEPVESYFVPAAGAPGPEDPPLVRITPDFADSLLSAVIAGATASIRITGDVRPASSRNVIGLLAGADAALRDQAVVIGAHMDHLGLRGGALHPGADDNASGVAAVLEIARALAASPAGSRRSVVFAFWTSEEPGQYGSGFYVRAPLWPLARTTAYVNLDMIAHPWSAEEIRDLVTRLDPAGAPAFLSVATPKNFAEPGLARSSPWLGEALAQAGRATGMSLHLDRVDGRSGGSDYRSFARAGLPWIRVFGNFFPEYHEPGDTLDRLDPQQVQRMARLALATTWILADRQGN